MTLVSVPDVSIKKKRFGSMCVCVTWTKAGFSLSSTFAAYRTLSSNKEI
jgi:hypothetical protein